MIAALHATVAASRSCLAAAPATRSPVNAVERLAQTALGVEARMRHWHRVDDQRVTAKSFDLESQPLEILAIRIERFALGGPEVKRQWKQQPLRGRRTALERVHELLVENALVRRVLIDENQSLFVLERDVGAPELKERRNRCAGAATSRRSLRSRIPSPSSPPACSTGEQEASIAIDRRPKNLGIRIWRQVDRTKAEARSAKAERRRAIEVAECAPHRGLDRALDGPSITEPDFGLRRVDVHVDGIGGHA